MLKLIYSIFLFKSQFLLAVSNTTIDHQSKYHLKTLKLPPLVITETVESNNIEVESEFNSGNIPFSNEIENYNVSVVNGYGSKVLDSIQNELGVSLNHLEVDTDISLERRTFQWWKRKLIQNESQFHFENSTGYSHIRSRALRQNISTIQILEFGSVNDQRIFYYRENKINPYLSQYSKTKSSQLYNERFFLKYHLKLKNFEVLPEFDLEEKKTFIGAKESGFSTTQQKLLGSLIKGSNLNEQYLIFVRSLQSQFESKLMSINSSMDEEWQFGLKYKNKKYTLIKELPWSQVEIGLNKELLKRRFTSLNTTNFERNSLQLLINQPFKFSEKILNGDGKIVFSTNYISENMKATNVNKVFKNKSDQSLSTPISYDISSEYSAIIEKQYGLKIQGRKYTQHPKPSQRFGDGRNLIGNEDLKLSEGLRYSFGPWINVEDWTLNLSAYAEETKNEPIVMMTSPLTAKTVSIGQVQARGYDFDFEKKWNENHKLKFKYNYQMAFNATKIDWQYGNPLPGRPEHVIMLEYNYNPIKNTQLGFFYLYKSIDAMDLSDMWKHSPHHDLSLYYGIKDKNWEWRVMGSGLLSHLNDIPKTLEGGMAGVDLLESSLDSNEIKFQCEINL